MTQLQPHVLGLSSLALLCALAFSSPLPAQDLTQTVGLVRVDVQKLSSGARASKIIGKNIVSDSNDVIGRIDDVIISPDATRMAYVVVAVGGWLGIGSHLIVLSFDNLRMTNGKINLPGVTKEELKALPEFKYSNNMP